MKKLMLVLVCAFSLCAVVASGAEEAFLGWRIKDATVLKAALAKDKTLVTDWQRRAYTFNLIQIEAPEKVATWADLEKTMTDEAKKYNDSYLAYEESVWYEALLQLVFCNKVKALGPEVSKDPRSAKALYYLTYFVVLYPEEVGLPDLSLSERRLAAVTALKVAINKGQVNTASLVLDKYIEFTVEEEDAVVIKELLVFNRMVKPRLVDVKWKPMSLKLDLALNSRGVGPTK